jgi:hypothetical protein
LGGWPYRRRDKTQRPVWTTYMTRNPQLGAVADILTSGLLQGFPDAARMASRNPPLFPFIPPFFPLPFYTDAGRRMLGEGPLSEEYARAVGLILITLTQHDSYMGLNEQGLFAPLALRLLSAQQVSSAYRHVGVARGA